MYVISNNSIKTQVKYSNTYNVFCKIFNYSVGGNLDWHNSYVKQMAEKAYINGNKIFLTVSGCGFTEEVVFYDNMVYCFAVIKDYRILYNYLSPNELGIDYEVTSLSMEQRNRLHTITRGKVGNLDIIYDNGIRKNCTVINTFESFLDYIRINSLPKVRSSNEPFLRQFIENLHITKICATLINHKYGTLSYNYESSTEFTYIYFENLIIITSYVKELPLLCPF